MHTTPQICCGHGLVRPRRRSACDRVSVTGQIFQSRITAGTHDGIQPAWRRSFPWLHARPGSSHVLRSERDGASSAALPPHLPTPAAIGPRYPIVAVVLCVRGSAVRISEVTSIINVSSLPGSRPHMTAPHIISTRVIPVAHRIHLIVSPRTVTRKAWTIFMHFVRSHMPHNLNSWNQVIHRPRICTLLEEPVPFEL